MEKKNQNYVIWIKKKLEEIYLDIAEDVETSFDTSNYKLDRPLPNGKIKTVIGLMRNELGGKIMTKFAASGSIKHSYDNDENKNA